MRNGTSNPSGSMPKPSTTSTPSCHTTAITEHITGISAIRNDWQYSHTASSVSTSVMTAKTMTDSAPSAMSPIDLGEADELHVDARLAVTRPVAETATPVPSICLRMRALQLRWRC